MCYVLKSDMTGDISFILTAKKGGLGTGAIVGVALGAVFSSSSSYLSTLLRPSFLAAH